MRTASLCAFLASRYRLHVVTFAVGDPPPTPAPAADRWDWVRLPVHRRDLAARSIRNASRLARGVLPLSDRFSQPDSLSQVARAIAGRRYEVAVVEHFWCASYHDLLAGQAACVVMDMHNIESALHARCASSDRFPGRWAHRLFARVAVRAEREWLPRFDLVLVASDADRDRLRSLEPGARVAVYPNALPRRLPDPVEEDHCVAFSGNLEYHPNVAAVRYFAREVWPALRQQDPRLRWRLIGKNEWAVRRWTAADPRIETTGAVDDPLRELARARVVVAPLLAGSGTRIKILEAWAAGRAVVSTHLGAEGLPARDGENLLLADTPAGILEAVTRLLGDRDLRRRLGEAGRAVVDQQLCWPVVWQGLERSLAVELRKPSDAILR